MARRMETGREWRGSVLRKLIWGGATCLLLLPLVAMQFTSDVNWTLRDFLTFGTMLAVACGTYEIAARSTRSVAYRMGVGIAVAASFFLVWINLAVGIIGSETNRANLLFAGVIAVAILGAVVARFRPAGMSRAMVVAAIAEALVPVIAMSVAPEVLGLTGVFVAMWLVSAWCFRIAARQEVAGA
jgi:hypothetical protein